MIVTEDSLASIIDGFPSIQINSSTNLKPQFGWGDDKELNRYIALRKSNEARYKASFAIVLNPLTDNLIKGLSSSNITSRSNSEYKIIKLPNYSDDEIKNGTIDLWDAISLKIDIRFTNNLKNLKPIIYENS